MKLLSLKKYLLFVLFLLSVLPVKAYSVLTHEAIVDASWDSAIKPFLKKRFPQTADADLRTAHSYAYGGTMMADIGYSPFGSIYYTNLVHYVRSGDFVNNLILESQNVNELAYALGALCHYMADRYGHSIGTNLVVPMIYPKIEKKFGNVVTYEDDHISHSRVEIAFDVLQIARGNYASEAYHDFIGFNVAKPVLERAFLKTYGQNINELFSNLDRSINNFRWAVHSLMPTVTKGAWLLKKDELKKTDPGITARKFRYKMQRKKYFAEFGRDRDMPKFKERVLAFIITIAPKIGPLRVFKFKEVNRKGEKQFVKSFDTVMAKYAGTLTQLDYKKPNLPNVDFDTGKKTTYDEYELTNKTYDDLLEKLQANKFVSLTPQLKENILSFYRTVDTIATTQADPESWKKTSKVLQQLRAAQTVPMNSLKVTDDKEMSKPTPSKVVSKN